MLPAAAKKNEARKKVKSWQDLRKEFNAECEGEWKIIYPDTAFIEMTIKRVFSFYDRQGSDKPANREAWLRAINFFLSQDWQKKRSVGHATNLRAGKNVPFEPKARKYGLDQPSEPVTESCAFCLDLKVVRVFSLDAPVYETLMLCECADEKDNSNWKLMKWYPQTAALYRKEQCPTDWFKPIKNGKIEYGMIDELAKKWRKRIRYAEEFWEIQRKICLIKSSEEVPF